MYPISPVLGKSLFQLHAEKILAISRRYGAVMPFYIMTSETNDEHTKQFFRDNDHFGLAPEDVQCVIQDMLPAVDFSGKIIMDAKNHVFMSPTGHGAALWTLHDRGDPGAVGARRRGERPHGSQLPLDPQREPLLRRAGR